MREPTPEELTAIQQLASFLTGTCGESHEPIVASEAVCAPLRGVDNDLIGAWLDSHGEIFVCAWCGWWCEHSEMCSLDEHNGEQVCAECGGEADD